MPLTNRQVIVCGFVKGMRFDLTRHLTVVHFFSCETVNVCGLFFIPFLCRFASGLRECVQKKTKKSVKRNGC